MIPQFKWYCCRHLLRIVCVDCRFADNKTFIFHKCRDKLYKSDRICMNCEKGNCANPRRRHGEPMVIRRSYA